LTIKSAYTHIAARNLNKQFFDVPLEVFTFDSFSEALQKSCKVIHRPRAPVVAESSKNLDNKTIAQLGNPFNPHQFWQLLQHEEKSRLRGRWPKWQRYPQEAFQDQYASKLSQLPHICLTIVCSSSLGRGCAKEFQERPF
jgi:hypothetical protein